MRGWEPGVYVGLQGGGSDSAVDSVLGKHSCRHERAAQHEVQRFKGWILLLFAASPF